MSGGGPSSGDGGGGAGGRDDGYKTPRAGGAGGGGGGDGSPDRCDIVQTVALNSPQASVVSALNVGDVLSVAVGGTPANPVLEVRTGAGAIAGSLTQRGHVEIINCISDGYSYKATVVQRSGGMVTLQVQRA